MVVEFPTPIGKICESSKRRVFFRNSRVSSRERNLYEKKSVLVNDENHIVATGYNGVPRNFPHCIETPCEGAAFPPGEGLDKCLAIHAELNALLQLNEKGPLTMYTTDTPCNECAKVIANSHIERIVAKRKYAQDTLSFLERVGIKVEIKC